MLIGTLICNLIDWKIRVSVTDMKNEILNINNIEMMLGKVVPIANETLKAKTSCNYLI